MAKPIDEIRYKINALIRQFTNYGEPATTVIPQALIEGSYVPGDPVTHRAPSNDAIDMISNLNDYCNNRNFTLTQERPAGKEIVVLTITQNR